MSTILCIFGGTTDLNCLLSVICMLSSLIWDIGCHHHQLHLHISIIIMFTKKHYVRSYAETTASNTISEFVESGLSFEVHPTAVAVMHPRCGMFACYSSQQYFTQCRHSVLAWRLTTNYTKILIFSWCRLSHLHTLKVSTLAGQSFWREESSIAEWLWSDGCAVPFPVCDYGD